MQSELYFSDAARKRSLGLTRERESAVARWDTARQLWSSIIVLISDSLLAFVVSLSLEETLQGSDETSRYSATPALGAKRMASL